MMKQRKEEGDVTYSMKRHMKVCEKNFTNLKNQANIFVKNCDDGASGNVQKWTFDYDKIGRASIKMIIHNDDWILHKTSINFKPIFSHTSKDICISVM